MDRNRPTGGLVTEMSCTTKLTHMEPHLPFRNIAIGILEIRQAPNMIHNYTLPDLSCSDIQTAISHSTEIDRVDYMCICLDLVQSTENRNIIPK